MLAAMAWADYQNNYSKWRVESFWHAYRKFANEQW